MKAALANVLPRGGRGLINSKNANGRQQYGLPLCAACLVRNMVGQNRIGQRVQLINLSRPGTGGANDGPGGMPRLPQYTLEKRFYPGGGVVAQQLGPPGGLQPCGMGKRPGGKRRIHQLPDEPLIRHAQVMIR